MKFIVCAFSALLCVLSAFAFPTPGEEVPPQCIDPTFACQDLQSAKLCNVVEDCIHDVWSTMSVPESDDNDEICDICKEMVKEARDQLLSNMTQEEIKEVFEGSCKLLPIKLIANACIKVVDEIIPQLVEMLASRMDPTMVCTVSGMCFSSKKDMSVERHILTFVKDFLVRQKNDDECSECTTMITDVQVFLKSTPEADVKTYLEKFCHEKMPSYLCKIVVNTYFNDIYSTIVNTSAAKLCGSVGICPQKCQVLSEAPKVGDELTCEFCQHLLQHVIDLITANTTLEEFRTALLNFCKKTGKFADKCTDMVNSYYDMIFKYIKDLDTRGMCTLIGLCNNATCTQIPLIKVFPAREPLRRFPMMKLHPAQPVQDLESFPLVRLVPAEVTSKKQMRDSNDLSQLPLDRLTHPLDVFQKDTECALCKAFSFYLEKDLAGDRSKEGVRQAISGMCDKWMKEYPEHCSRIVNNYSLKMQMAIAKGISPSDLCPEVKVCPLENDQSGNLNVKVISKISDTPFCDLCKDAMNEVEKQLSDPALKQKLEKALGQVCNILPKSFRDDCTNFINQNIDALIDILQQELNPDQICPALGLCKNAVKIGVPLRIKDLECDVCKDVVSSFRTKLQDPASKEIVQTFLEEGCIRLPESVASECKKFVDENIDTVMKIIIEALDPQKVCCIFNICPAQMKVEKKLNDVECDLCKEVVGKVEDLVKDKKTEDEIKSALNRVCSYLPPSLATKCTKFVNQYTDLIVTLLMQEMDPEMVCAALKLCPKQLKVEKPNNVKDLECDLCKEVVGKVKDMIQDKKTEDEIKAALDKVCTYLPSSMASRCTSFVNQYTDLLISLLMEEMDPDMVCAALNVCPEKLQLSEWKSKAVDVECQGCQYALHFLQEQLMSNDTQDEVKNVLKKMCDVLPKTYSSNCEAFVDEYGSSLLVLIAQEIDPSTMCYELKMCPKQVSPLTHFHVDECSVCTTVVDYMDKLLEEDDVDQEITRLVEKVCIVVPASFRDRCSSLLETYGPYILQMIGQVADSKQLCQEIDLCSRVNGHVHLIGGAKCTFGPSYWCRSAAHAAACKAESYCKSKVWTN